MVLESASPGQHNQMLGRKIRHPRSTNFDGTKHDEEQRSPKRRRIGGGDFFRRTKTDAPDSEAEEDNPGLNEGGDTHETDLETALPEIQTDQKAIEEYEKRRAVECETGARESKGSTETKWVKGRSSIYLDAFNLALDTVLEEEAHLFDAAEHGVFRAFRELSYEAQYLYVRLFLRKTSAWHRVNSLGYHSDIADLEGAIAMLQQRRDLPAGTGVHCSHPGELELPEGTALSSSFTFADQSETEITTLKEASSLLRLEELKTLAKDAKVQGKNKQELLKALRCASEKQTGLGRFGLKRSDTETSTRSTGSGVGGDLPEIAEDIGDTDSNRDVHFMQRILAITGPCVRLSLAPLKLFERVHLVFYRSTEWTEKSLTTIILAKIARRNFPPYIVSRSANIFPSRALLLEFEAAIRTQSRVDNLLEFSNVPNAEAFRIILDIYEDVYPRWLVVMKEEISKEDTIYHSGEGAYLRRLSPAWVYTRIMHKAAYVMGRLKQHKWEHSLLCELLGQRLFHSSRRGAWYQRKALLEEHYMAALTPDEGRSDEAQKKHWKRVALQTCQEGLEDPLVHIIHHYDLQKRVQKLEKWLRIPKRAQHDFSHVRLTAPVEVTVEGTRIEKEGPAQLDFEESRRNSATPTGNRRGAKTIWEDPLEGNGECSVEAMCLSHYRSQGWKGYHSEGGIVRTLFAYLFYDVFFTYVPNVFQTPYQTCPLDLHTDAFYPCRLSEINHRLADLGNGGAEALIRRVWDEHSEKKTCVVGLDWSFELEDLVAIARCFPGDALATVCKVLAQEYGQRGGGIPDLFLWHDEKKEVMFVEVKSENDRLSDTQRLWVHVLTGAGIRVELCNAVAKEVKRVIVE